MCAAGARGSGCLNSERSYVFRLRIDKVVENATGELAFVKGDHRWGTLPFDKNPENNAATIVVNASGADIGGGAGGGGGSQPASADSAGGTGRHDMLADTGTDSPLLIGATAGAAVLTGGGLLLALTARRQPRRSPAR